MLQALGTRGESDLGAMMGSTLGSRPYHYETLGLTHTATAEEIERAYAREIIRPRAFGGLAEIGIAYATLRDQAKRRAYDEAIGVAPKPQPIAPAMINRWQMTAPVHLNPVVQTLHRSVAPPARAPEPASPAPSESFIAASLRELANPEPLVRSVPEPRRPQAEALLQPEAEPAPQPQRAPDIVPVVQELPEQEVDETASQWQRPAAVGGGLLAAAVLFGAWAGTAVRDPEQPVDAETGVTMAVPAATSRASASEPAEVGDVENAPANFALAKARKPVRRQPVAEQAKAPMPLTPEEERELAGGQFAESAVQQASAAAEAIPPAEQAAVATQARLPLSGRTVARTIGRIGYACGSVASISDAGSPGVFKVTCTSGDAYQARPVRGRYHFRRWGRP